MNAATETCVDDLARSGPRPPVRPRSVGRRLAADRWARRVVTLGGMLIIASILTIFLVIAGEVVPLLRRPVATRLASVAAPSDSRYLAIMVDEYSELAVLVHETGLVCVSLADGAVIQKVELPWLADARIVSAFVSPDQRVALGLSDGRVGFCTVRFSLSFEAGARHVEPSIEAGEVVVMDPEGREVRFVAHAEAASGPITAAAMGPNQLAILTVEERRALIGESTREEKRHRLLLPIEGMTSAMVLDRRGESLLVGTSTGRITRIDLRDSGEPRIAQATAVTSRSGMAVTSLGFLLGDRTLIVGDESGSVTSWQLLGSGGDGLELTRIYEFDPHKDRVIAVAASFRDKGFATADASGMIRLHYGTTGKSLLTIPSRGAALSAMQFAPRGDGIITVDTSAQIQRWMLSQFHPEVTWKSLFGKVWYEGYSAPAYVWQSTGGSDDFEAKLSLVPLIFGTLKGTFYAMVFAIPVALLGALYTSQFIHPHIKGWVKPTIEIMAALPSVVLGFIAGLWLAPAVERVVPGIFVMPVLIPLLILLALAGWNAVPRSIRSLTRPGYEVCLLVPVVVIGIWLSTWVGSLIEVWLLSADYRTWLLQVLGLTYDQRNSLVVGFAMGFAVIPIIFTIAEDSLSNVPQHLSAASLALGATRWQTAIRVVVPTASPGIFSAIMIGFGRAVGETMIVLMATGNTPVTDWSIFNGFRALSANIAVELPEAPTGGTLYRVLFLAALLLFLMTFLVNTAAEVVRLRLRHRFRYL